MLLDRLRRMTAAELRWRAAAVTRTSVERVSHRVRPPQWRRSDLARVLSGGIVDTPLESALHRRDWLAVHEALDARLRSRPARFVLDPASTRTIRDAVLARWPCAAVEAASSADRILEGRVDLLGYRDLSFGRDGEIDWHVDPVHGRRAPRTFYADVPYLDPAIGDHKVIWEINRHQHWLRLGRAAWLTGDTRYALRIIEELESWLRQNPPLVGINWASMLEIGFRTLSWVWALHCLLGLERVATAKPSPWLVDLFVALHRQLTHLEHNLSYYFSPNTHLTGEALALYVAGTGVPELGASKRWARTGRRILLAEIERQVLPDGGHAERSTHYQRYTLDFYLLALLTARAGGDADAEAAFAGAALRLAEFTRSMATDQGRLPLIGDDDGGMLWPLRGRACDDVRDSLALAAVLFERPDLAPWGPSEEILWIGGVQAATAATWDADVAPGGAPSRSFRDTGYVVARDASGGHAVLDAGAHGYMNAGHAHADALSLTLALEQRPLLVDPGTFTYTMNPILRDRMRGTAAHNTVVVDGLSQSQPAGAFHWRTRTDGRLDLSRHNPGFDWVEASHDGYPGVRHRRTLIRAGGSGWLVVDDLTGSGEHAAAAHWHFDPQWTVRVDGGRIRAVSTDGSAAWLLCDEGDVTLFNGDTHTGLGWMAPVYGTLVPASVARVTKRGSLPVTMITWIGGGSWTLPLLTRIDAECDPTTPAIAAQVEDGDVIAVFMLRPGGTAPHAARACRVAAFETDARMLHYRAAGDQLLAVDLAEGRYLSPARRGWLSLEADRQIADLHVSLADGVVELQASSPPPPLRLRVSAPFHAVRLNGLELPHVPGSPDSVSIAPADWDPAERISSPAQPWRPSGAAFADH